MGRSRRRENAVRWTHVAMLAHGEQTHDHIQIARARRCTRRHRGAPHRTRTINSRARRINRSRAAGRARNRRS